MSPSPRRVAAAVLVAVAGVLLVGLWWYWTEDQHDSFSMIRQEP